MIGRTGLCVVLCGLASIATPGLADQFEQLDGPLLLRMLRGPEVSTRTQVQFAEIGGMPTLLADTRSTLLLARTDQDNPVRLLVNLELRKSKVPKEEPIPVVVLERLDTFDAGEPTTRLASRKDLVVFEGFQVDLDTGQVVPPGQGGDLVFKMDEKGGPRLETLGSAKLYVLAKPPTFDNAKAPQPTPGKRVVPGDFAGRYRLFANGQWSGTLDLKVEGRGVVTGQFRSDLHGTTYPVTGQVSADVAHKLLFAIKYPRARQEFEGYLWAEGKGALAGVASIAERPVGFFAVREGARFAPEGTDLGPLAGPGKDQPGELVVELAGERITAAGKATTLEELSRTLKALVEDESKPTWVVLRAPADQKYGELTQLISVIQDSRVQRLRFEIPEPRQ